MAFAGSAQGDALIDGDVAAHDGGFADDNTGSVVDEQAAAQERARMDIDASEKAGELRNDACRQPQVRTPEHGATR